MGFRIRDKIVEILGGRDDKHYGLALGQPDDPFYRIHLTPQGQILQGDGTAAPAPLASGGGSGAASSDTVVAETGFGQGSAPGTGTTHARGDHTHGTPADPVPAHAAAPDPHPGYRLESSAIGTADLADRSVTSTKIAFDSILGQHIADNSLSGVNLADGSVTAAKVAPDVATQAELDAEKVLRTHVTLWAAVGYTATNAPAEGMEPSALSGTGVWTGRVRMDARRATHFRTWHVLTAVVAANGVRFEYSTDVGTTWNTLIDMGAGSAVQLSAWTVLPDAAKVADLTIRAMVYGDGVADPVLRRAQVEFGAP